MVAPAETLQRIDIALHALECALADLPEIAEEWDRLPEGERVSWSLDWDHLMGSYIARLDEHRLAGEMSAEQDQRYSDLRQGFRSALPTIDLLNLYRPSITVTR